MTPAATSVYVTPAAIASIATIGNAASRDGITPVICTIRVSFTPDSPASFKLDRDGNPIPTVTLVAIATDRYRVARLTTTISLETPLEEEFSILAPAEFWKRAAAAVKSKTGAPIVCIALDEERQTVTVNDYDNTLSAPLTVGNYPPIERLLPAADERVEVGAPSLNPAYLVDLAKLRLPEWATSKSRPEVAAMSAVKTDNPAKPGPVIFTFKNDSGVIDYMVQPSTPRSLKPQPGDIMPHPLDARHSRRAPYSNRVIVYGTPEGGIRSARANEEPLNGLTRLFTVRSSVSRDGVLEAAYRTFECV